MILNQYSRIAVRGGHKKIVKLLLQNSTLSRITSNRKDVGIDEVQATAYRCAILSISLRRSME